jgi:integrase
MNEIAKKSAKKKSLTRTAETYRQIASRFQKSVGNAPISVQTICAHLDRLNDEKRSSYTVNLDCKMLCSQYVSESSDLETRAMRTAETEKIKKHYIVKIQPEDYQQKALTVEQTEAFLAALPTRLMLIVKTLVNTGMRISELCSLHYSKAEKRPDGYWYFTFTGKGKKQREIFLSQDELTEIQNVFGGGKGFLFITENSKPFDRTYISRELNKKGKKVFGKDFRIHAHTFRHTWATQSLKNGESIEAVQHAGGWADPSFVLRHYAHNRINAGSEKFRIASKKRIG